MRVSKTEIASYYKDKYEGYRIYRYSNIYIYISEKTCVSMALSQALSHWDLRSIYIYIYLYVDIDMAPRSICAHRADSRNSTHHLEYNPGASPHADY